MFGNFSFLGMLIGMLAWFGFIMISVFLVGRVLVERLDQKKKPPGSDEKDK